MEQYIYLTLSTVEIQSYHITFIPRKEIIQDDIQEVSTGMASSA